MKRTRSRFRQFRSNLSQEIRDSNVLPQDLQNLMIKELDKRLDYDLDELLDSPKLKFKLSPAELDKILLEFYNNISEGPGGDVLRMIGGGANVGRQKYYMKQQSLRLRRLQQQEEKNKKQGSSQSSSSSDDEKGTITTALGPRNTISLSPEFLEDVNTGGSSSVTKQIKLLLKRNFIPKSTRDPTLKGEESKSTNQKKISKSDTPTMALNGFQQPSSLRISHSLYTIPKASFLRSFSLPYRTKLPTPLI